MTEEGLPLGLMDQKIYQHCPEGKVEHKRRPITEKQSFRWIEALRTTKSSDQDKPIVAIADRESDIFEFFVEANEIQAKILIRATKDRILEDEEQQTLWTWMKKVPLAGVHTIHLPARHQQDARMATLEVKYSEITLTPPQRYPGAKEKTLYPVKMQAIWLYEPNPSEGIDPLEWMLLTNLSVTSLEEAIKMGKWYRLRWQIENYHRVLKSG